MAGRPDGPLDLPGEYAQYSIYHGRLLLCFSDGYGYADTDRVAALRFARDIDNGLLDHFPIVKAGTK